MASIAISILSRAVPKLTGVMVGPGLYSAAAEAITTFLNRPTGPPLGLFTVPVGRVIIVA